MGKLFANIAGVAASCYVIHAAAGGGWKALSLSVATCVIANLVGLGQNPPAILGGRNPS